MGRKKIFLKSRIGEEDNRFQDKNGYWKIRVIDEKTGEINWLYEHRFIWEKHNGSIPKGCVIKFIDGDRNNLNIENLRLGGVVRVGHTEKIEKEMEEWKYEVGRLTEENNQLKAQLNNLLDSIGSK